MAIDSHGYQRTGSTTDGEQAWGRSHILLACDWWFSRAKDGGEQHHVLVCGRISEETRSGKDGMVFGIAASENVDDPTPRAFARIVIGLDNASSPGGTRAVAGEVRLAQTACASMASLGVRLLDGWFEGRAGAAWDVAVAP